MVEAKELRIGNKLHFIVKPKKDKERPEVVTVVEITRRGILCDYSGVDMMFEKDAPDLHPIPLTPEILLKAGFETIKDKGIIDTFEYRELVVSDTLTFTEGDINGYCDVFVLEHDYIRVRYLHQLQNLYYALTGQELTLTL